MKPSIASSSVPTEPGTVETIPFEATDASTEQQCLLDDTGRILAVCKRWGRTGGMFGAPAGAADSVDVLRTNYLDACDGVTGPGADAARRAAEGIRQVIRGERETFEQHYLRHESTEPRWFVMRATRLRGHGSAVVVAHRDVSSWTRDEVARKLAVTAFTHAREGITVTDAHARILEVNQAFTDITGYTRAEALGRNPSLLKSGRQGAEFYAAMWRDLHAHGRWSGEVWNRHKSGEVYASMLNINAIRDAGGKTQHYVALFSDITAAKEHERQLEQIVHYDPLTRLPNRVLFADRLEQAILQCKRRGLQLAVAYLDLDGFKAINEQHGHDVGDELLIVMAGRLQAALREGGTVARMGGDEFAAIMVDLVDARDCEAMLNRLLHATVEPVRIGSHCLRISASIGVTLYPQDAADAELLLRHADQAMYQAKLAGRNRAHLFDVIHHEAVTTRRDTLNQIRRALERREFVLHYQPKVNMRTGAIIGVEALVRWQHPERGLLPPATFLPLIEDHPLSLELGDWVISQALGQMVEWRVQGLAMPVSVNVGAYHLQHADFVPRLAKLVADHPLVEPGWLELEVLETSALDDVAKVSQAMHDCRALGVRFALDDFGTGYSTLTYLSKLPAELLKIDQSFVRDMLSDPGNRAIVEGVIGLARAFRRQVIAEGVESVAHGRALLKLGCELAQGYGIARPMPAAALTGWAARWRPEPAWTESEPACADDRSGDSPCALERDS